MSGKHPPKQNDIHWLTEVVDQYAARLTLYAAQLCDAPDDVVQEALLKLAGQSPRPRQTQAWLFCVVRNNALSRRRADLRRTRREREVAQQRPIWFHSNDEDALDCHLAARALQSLDQSQREVVTLHLWGGLSFHEIGELLQTSRSTAHRWYVQGLQELRKRLQISCQTDH